MPRDWGQWTVIKLEAIEKYVSAFTVASKRAKCTLYLDLFGGRPTNQERGTERVFPGSALRAAAVTPPFTKLIVSELSRSAAAEQATQLQAVAGSRAVVVQGDCNVVIPAQLARLDEKFRWAATFALLDQFSAEIHWDTLRKLAEFKAPTARTKVELCMFFGESFMLRGLRGADGRPNAGYAARLDELFGNQRWREIVAAREDEEITGAAAQAELVNLMRWQLERDLGYRTTLALKVRNTMNNRLFTMIFATDHDVGAKIMRGLFEGAEDALDQMVLQNKVDRLLAREAEQGIGSLFDAETELSVRVPDAPKERPPSAAPVPPFRWGRLWDDDQW